MVPYGPHAPSGAEGSRRRPRRRVGPHRRAHLAARPAARSRRPRQHRRRPLEPLGGVVGRRRADRRPARPLRRQHLLSGAQHARLLRGQHRRRAAGACRRGRSPATRTSRTTSVVVIGFVLAVAGAYYLVRYLSGSREAAAVAGVLFGFCPFVFARTAHIQLLLTGGSAVVACWPSIACVDRPSPGRAVTLGVVLWAQALSCAYYGIFAGLMVGLGTLVFAVTRAAVAIAALLGRDRRWPPRCRIGLTLPFFLPYLQVAGPGVRAHARRCAACTAPTAARGWPRRPGPIAGGSRAHRGLQRGAVPGRHRGRRRGGRRRAGVALTARASRGRSRPGARRRRLLRGAGGHRLLGVVRSRRRALSPALRDRAGLRAAARAGTDGHHRHARADRAVGRAAGTVAQGARPAADLGRRAGRAGRAGAEHRAADRAARGPAGARGVPDAGPAAAGAAGRVPLLLAPHRLPAARRVHARLDVPLAAAGERLQRLHPRGMAAHRRGR